MKGQVHERTSGRGFPAPCGQREGQGRTQTRRVCGEPGAHLAARAGHCFESHCHLPPFRDRLPQPRNPQVEVLLSCTLSAAALQDWPVFLLWT